MVNITFAQDETAIPAFPGQIAYVGTDYNVYTLNGQDGSRAMLTDDAGPGRNRLQIYQWPTWSRDGRLAYFATAVNSAGQIDSTDVYVSADGTSAGEMVYSGAGEAMNYAYWSPQDCESGESCRDLAVLLSGGGSGLFVELVRDGSESTTENLGTGAPFYYSWS